MNEPYAAKSVESTIKSFEKERETLKDKIKTANDEQKIHIQDRIDYINNWLNNVENEKWSINQGEIDSYKSYAYDLNYFENSALLYAREYSVDNSYAKLFERYAQGQINVDQLLEKLESIIHLINNEN